MIIEVKAFFKTDKGERIMNFFTHVTPVLSGEILTDEDYFINEISEIVNEMMICKLPEKVLAGWAIASYQGNELFTLSFFTGKVEDEWKYQTYLEEDEPTIH